MTRSIVALLAVVWPNGALAQAMQDMPGMNMPQPPQASPTPQMTAAAPMTASMTMTGAFGSYAMSREASGTAWQPDSTPDGGLHVMLGQHPHDLFMEQSASYSLKISAGSSVFFYAGLPGEPALGPPAFMHRASGMDIPEAPITHHWLDSTHITYGVLTAGYIHDAFKIEGSVFRGREPNQARYDVEAPQLDSVSARLSYNPGPNWSMQASWGYLTSPEQLPPRVNENRVTASAAYNLPFGPGSNWATTFAWGRKMNAPGHDLDGFLIESELVLRDLNTVFARAERVDEDELFDLDTASPLQGSIFTVDKLSVGYIRDVQVAPHIKLGAGGLVSRYAYPAALDRAYGSPTSFMLFLRLKLN